MTFLSEGSNGNCILYEIFLFFPMVQSKM